jgi:hypothetical protein
MLNRGELFVDSSFSAQMIAVRAAYSAMAVSLIKAGLITMDDLKDAFADEEARLLRKQEDEGIKEPVKAILKDAVSALATLYPFDPNANPPRPAAKLRLVKCGDP